MRKACACDKMIITGQTQWRKKWLDMMKYSNRFQHLFCCQKPVNLWRTVALEGKESALLTEEDPYFCLAPSVKLKTLEILFLSHFINTLLCPSFLIDHPEVKQFLDSSVCSMWNFSAFEILSRILHSQNVATCHCFFFTFFQNIVRAMDMLGFSPDSLRQPMLFCQKVQKIIV